MKRKYDNVIQDDHESGIGKIDSKAEITQRKYYQCKIMIH